MGEKVWVGERPKMREMGNTRAMEKRERTTCCARLLNREVGT